MQKKTESSITVDAEKAEVKEIITPAAGQIYTLIGKIMGEIDAIGKNGESKDYNGKVQYKFRGIDQVYNALNPVMAKYGVFVCPEILDQTRENRTSSNGKPLIYSILTVRFTVYAPDGSSIQMVIIGEGMDSGDKATNKAMSIAMKYAMFQLFMIPTDEMRDPDADVHNLQPTPPPEPPKPQKAPGASVTTSRRVPEPEPQPEPPKPLDVSTVKGYLLNEIAFMSRMFEISDKKAMNAKFESMRKELVAKGIVPDKKADTMTMEEAHHLIQAIIDNFMTDKKEQPA